MGQTRPLFVYFRPYSQYNDKYNAQFDYISVGFEPVTAIWWARTNPLSYVDPHSGPIF